MRVYIYIYVCIRKSKKDRQCALPIITNLPMVQVTHALGRMICGLYTYKLQTWAHI